MTYNVFGGTLNLALPIYVLDVLLLNELYFLLICRREQLCRHG